MEGEIVIQFDFSQLATEARTIVKQRVEELHKQETEFNLYTRRTVEAAWQMGQALADIRHHTEHGQFLDIIKSEFPHWSERSIYNFINLHKTFKFATVANLNIGLKALYMLASPSTSESIRQEFIEEAEAGKPVKHKDVKVRVKTGGIPKTTIKPLIADTALVGYDKKQQTRLPSKGAYSSSDNQSGQGDDFSQITEDDIDQTGTTKRYKSPEEKAAIGVLEVLGWTCIPPEAADEPTCAYCGKAFK